MSRPVFGVDRDPASVPGSRSKSGTLRSNPLRIAHGPGPDGTRCGDCVHLHRGYSGRYFKCDLRRNTSSTSTDHRARWETCAKFEPQP